MKEWCPRYLRGNTTFKMLSCRGSFKTHVHTRRPFGLGSHNCIILEVLVVGTWTSSSKHEVCQPVLLLTLGAGLLSSVWTVIFLVVQMQVFCLMSLPVACFWNGDKASLQSPALCSPLFGSVNFYACVWFTRKEYFHKALPVNWTVMKVQSCSVFPLLKNGGNCSDGKQRIFSFLMSMMTEFS